MAGLDTYDSSDVNVTDDDGEADITPSQGKFDMHKKDDIVSSDDDSSDSACSFAEAKMAEARMAERNEKIRKRKLKRLNLEQSDEDEGEEMFGRTPYRKLLVQEAFTPPRKKSRPVVPDSEEFSSSEDEDEDDSGDDGHRALYTPKRIYQTNWKLVERWSTSLSVPEINRRIDAILAQSLKSAGYHAEHVSKSKDTDRAYWKEANVSFFVFVKQNSYLTRMLLGTGLSQQERCTKIPSVVEVPA